MTLFSIMIIDDEVSIRQGLSFALKKEYQVTSFATAEDALKVLKPGTADLVLLDLPY